MAERNRDDPAHHAAPLREQLRRLAETLVTEQQERVAGAASLLADGLRHAASELGPERRQHVGRYAEDAAARIERFSETIRQQHLSDLVAQAESLARRKPALFLAGAAAAGFALARALTAPAPARDVAATMERV